MQASEKRAGIYVHFVLEARFEGSKLGTDRHTVTHTHTRMHTHTK